MFNTEFMRGFFWKWVVGTAGYLVGMLCGLWVAGTLQSVNTRTASDRLQEVEVTLAVLNHELRSNLDMLDEADFTCPIIDCSYAADIESEMMITRSECMHVGGLWTVEYIETQIMGREYIRRWRCDLVLIDR